MPPHLLALAKSYNLLILPVQHDLDYQFHSAVGT